MAVDRGVSDASFVPDFTVHDVMIALMSVQQA
jgi:hypothetical protein